jgi:hypothetical protein
VRTNRRRVRLVPGIPHRNLNRATIGIHSEMMRRLVIPEAHSLIAVAFYDCLMLLSGMLSVHWAVLHVILLCILCESRERE